MGRGKLNKMSLLKKLRAENFAEQTQKEETRENVIGW
jgi:hypothetical protein